MSDFQNNKDLSENSAPENVFRDCYTQHWQAIYKYLNDRTNDFNMALDLTQNVFLKFWTLKNQYCTIGNSRAFLIQMAKNVFFDNCRQNKNWVACEKTVSYEIEVSKNLTEAMLDERELQRRLQQAILDLSKQRRIVFVLAKIEGWPREKIATTLDLSHFTVKVTLQNAIKDVRKRCRPG